MASPKVLIADDDSKLLKALTIRLSAEGFEVVTTQDAYQALDFARRHQPDVMLLDINMPAGKGFSVQERMRSIREISSIPVIYMTGDSSGKADEDAEKLGATVIHKPFNFQMLVATIWDAIDLSPRRQDVA